MLNMVGSPDGPALPFAKVGKMIAQVGAKLDISSKRVLTCAGPGGNDPAHASLSDQGQACMGGIGSPKYQGKTHIAMFSGSPRVPGSCAMHVGVSYVCVLFSLGVTLSSLLVHFGSSG